MAIEKIVSRDFYPLTSTIKSGFDYCLTGVIMVKVLFSWGSAYIVFLAERMFV